MSVNFGDRAHVKRVCLQVSEFPLILFWMSPYLGVCVCVCVREMGVRVQQITFWTFDKLLQQTFAIRLENFNNLLSSGLDLRLLSRRSSSIHIFFSFFIKTCSDRNVNCILGLGRLCVCRLCGQGVHLATLLPCQFAWAWRVCGCGKCSAWIFHAAALGLCVRLWRVFRTFFSFSSRAQASICLCAPNWQLCMSPC